MRISARRLHAYGWLLVNTVVFGATIPIVKWGLPDTTPMRFLLYRFFLAAVLSVPVLWHERHFLRRHWHNLGSMAALELVGTTLSLAVLYIGLKNTTAIQAGLITTAGPIFLALGALIFLKENVTKREWIGMGVACAATVALTILPALFSGQATWGGTFWGNTLVFSQNFLVIGYFLLAKRDYHHVPKLLTTSIGAIVSLVCFAVIAGAQAGSAPLLLTSIRGDFGHASVWIMAFFAAVVTSLIGQTAYVKGQDLIESSEAVLFTYLQPLIYIPLSFILLGEQISWFQGVFFAIILFGVCFAECRPRRKISPKPRRLHAHRH